MHARFCREDSLGITRVAVGDEDGIARIRLVVRERLPIRGPGWIRPKINEEFRDASHRGSHQRRMARRRSRLREPDLLSISREPGFADHRPRPRPKVSFRQVGERAAADLTDEDIDWSVAVREKDHKLAVRRDRSIDLLALEVGQTYGPRVSERIPPEIIVDPETPRDEHDGRENTGSDRAGQNPAA